MQYVAFTNSQTETYLDRWSALTAVNVIWFYLVTYIGTILGRVLAMARQEALVIITVQ